MVCIYFEAVLGDFLEISGDAKYVPLFSKALIKD